MSPQSQVVSAQARPLTLVTLDGLLELTEEIAGDSRKPPGTDPPVWTIMSRLEVVDRKTHESATFEPGWTLFRLGLEQYLVRDPRSGQTAELYRLRSSRPLRWAAKVLKQPR